MPEAPAGLVFGNRVTKRADFEWTLNQAHYVLEPATAPGLFRVHLDTETPSFDTFLAEIDGGQKKSVASDFSWNLHPGENRLRVRPRNVSRTRRDPELDHGAIRRAMNENRSGADLAERCPGRNL